MVAKHMLVLPWVLLLQITALACSTITVVGSYAGVLTAALVFTLMAVGLLIWPFRRGGMVMKIVCIIHALPTVFVFLDFLRRAPYVF